ncbi:MAG: FAD-dependent oxidoreductase [Thermoanaerobaculia bacterium]|jgi:monoamine oxidase|nr:FAD-dependent oxidoreductase [Thermoanaerobaculia bacterium]MBP9826009.1 FAD-dependent oxidoreductase [Thermoanaerobaculia bacterium]
MGKTALFSRLQGLLAVARFARQRGLPAREALAIARRAGGPTRREVLVGATLAGAGLTLGCERARSLLPGRLGGTGREVAIVGGGIAGLTCAWRLAQAGVTARVYEAQDRIGGRMWSLTGAFPEGQVCELGGELIDSNHERIRALAAELGLELDDLTLYAPELAKDLYYFDGRQYSDAEVVEAFTPVAERIDAAWETVTGETVSYREPNGGEAIDNQSIAEWLDGAECTGWFRKLLDVAYTTEYGLETGDQSAWNLLMMIDTEPDPFKVFGASDERFHVRGGNDLIPRRLAERLAGRIETGARLEAMTEKSDQEFRLTFRRGAGTFEVSAERVVLALPFTLLRDVDLGVSLPAVKRRAIAELRYGTNAKLMVGFSERIWRQPRGASGRLPGSNGSVLTDLPFQLTWETSRMQAGKAGILTNFTGGRRGVEMGQGTPAAQSEQFARELERVFPGAAGHRIGEARFHWPSFEFTKGSYSSYGVGQWTTIGGAEGERVGRLHFAGEHTSSDFQGFMEGGCESGERVAGEILADLGIAPPAAGSA